MKALFLTITLAQLFSTDMVGKARITWSKVVEGKRITVTIHGGEAKRLNPAWSPEPGVLKYDLDKHRALIAAIKAAKLGPSRKAPSEAPADRTLELWGDGPKDWEKVATWSMPAKKWEKTKPELFEKLEPLMEMQADVFVPMKGPEK